MCNVHYTHLTALISVLSKRKLVRVVILGSPLLHWATFTSSHSGSACMAQIHRRASDSVAYNILYTCTVMLSNADCIQTWDKQSNALKNKTPPVGSYTFVSVFTRGWREAGNCKEFLKAFWTEAKQHWPRLWLQAMYEQSLLRVQNKHKKKEESYSSPYTFFTKLFSKPL